MAESYPGKEKIWYEASCHCKAVQYKVRIPSLTGSDPLEVNSCNCSICHKHGYLLVYPSRDEVVWSHGYDELKDYRHGPKIKDHKFCDRCGSAILIDWNGFSKERDVLGVNVR